MKKNKLFLLMLLGCSLLVVGGETEYADEVDNSEIESYHDVLIEERIDILSTGVSVSQKKQFIEKIKPSILKYSDKYNVYGSVMAAQAILESGWGASKLSTEANNYFGIKGSYNGQSYPIETAEYINGKWVTVVENFRRYPNLDLSVADNGDKIRNGVSWDKSFYSGSWKENAKNFSVAANALTGKYATAPEYGKKLIEIINENNLSDLLDYDQIISQISLVQDGIMKKNTSKIKLFSAPYFTSYASRYAHAYGNQYSNQSLQVLEEVITDGGTTKWWHVKVNGVDKGWVDSKYVQNYDRLVSKKAVNYTGYMKTSKDTIRLYSEPYFTSAKSRYAKEYGNSYSNQAVQVIEEATTSRRTTKWWHVKVNGVDKGWVDSKYIGKN